ncbi:MAG: hypothetical protein IJT64_03360 [Kiritimatiellae bacterium]|nr:hypothetical protein [Kiritimatiellia bacterium]
MQQTAPVKARLWCIPEDAKDPEVARRKAYDVTIVGRDRAGLALAPDASGSMPSRIPFSRITAVDFDMDYDRFEVTKAMAKNDWAKAIRILSSVYSPLYPYLDLPENNGLEGAMDLGTTMMKFAMRTRRAAKTDAERTTASQQFDAAYKVFQACAKAEWSDLGALATLKGCRCMIAIDTDMAKTAARRIAAMDEPTPGDLAYGHYWLMKAELARLAGVTTNALDAAIKSLCFENKDVETFPDALMISAECYENLGEPYRARDVYFEVAKLFPGTDWADDAVARLEVILKTRKTEKREAATAESTFFGLEEDMNALSEALIKERKAAKEAAAKRAGEEEDENDN